MVIRDLTNMKPSIKIYYDGGHIDESSFKEVLYGIEEEGIPYKLEAKNESDAVSLGYKASIDSILGVGIGISAKYVVLHFEKLKDNMPLFKIKLLNSSDEMRLLGADAARLVKKMPFKDIKDR